MIRENLVASFNNFKYKLKSVFLHKVKIVILVILGVMMVANVSLAFSFRDITNNKAKGKAKEEKLLKVESSKQKCVGMSCSEHELANLIDSLLPGVVNIYTTQIIKRKGMGELENFFSFPPGSPFEQFFKDFGFSGQVPKERKVQSLGSGFVISEDGYIITNNHVIEKATEISVRLQNGKTYKAKLVGADKRSDVAVLKIQSNHKFKFLKIGNSDSLRVGYTVIAIGNPFGLGGTVTKGIVSALGRNIDENNFTDFIQTDAAINRGNSGGPMFNLKGEVIGINTAIYSTSGGSIGIGFAIPISSVQNIVGHLKKGGKFERPWLGVNIQDIDDNLITSLDLNIDYGVYVSLVVEKSPAAISGVLNDDIIISVNGQKIKNSRELQRVIANYSVDSKVKLEVLRQDSSKKKRNYKTIFFTVKLDKFPNEKDESQSKMLEKGEVVNFLGMKLSNLSKPIRKKFKIDVVIKGLFVSEVDYVESILGSNFVEKGSVIEKINGHLIDDIKDISNLIKRIKKDVGKDNYVTITMVIRKSKHNRVIISKAVDIDKIK